MNQYLIFKQIPKFDLDSHLRGNDKYKIQKCKIQDTGPACRRGRFQIKFGMTNTKEGDDKYKNTVTTK
ncbi:TPA: hypothetical protein DEP94_03230 [Candidatus Nomurabacteria bacterium]|nr:hypothetical protein [Candidatus Nomurabacteria bacterium]